MPGERRLFDKEFKLMSVELRAVARPQPHRPWCIGKFCPTIQRAKPWSLIPSI